MKSHPAVARCIKYNEMKHSMLATSEKINKQVTFKEQFINQETLLEKLSLYVKKRQNLFDRIPTQLHAIKLVSLLSYSSWLTKEP